MNTRLLMVLRVTVATPQSIGAVPHGTRRTVPITGGDFEGPRLLGSVLPGGSADWLLVRADGVLELDLRHIADRRWRADCDELVRLRHGPPAVIEALARGEAVDPAVYYFRTTAVRNRAPNIHFSIVSLRSRAATAALKARFTHP